MILIGGIIAAEIGSRNDECFSKVPVNASGVKPPLVIGPGYPPKARFEGVAIDEVVNGSPEHILAGFFNFRPLNWTEKRPKCYFRALEGFSENWTGFVLPGTSPSNVTLSGRVYLALYVYPKETSIIISRVEYGKTPEESKIAEAFHLKYPKSPEKYLKEYSDSLKEAGYTQVRKLQEGAIFEGDKNALLVLGLEDEGNIYLLLAKGSREDISKMINAFGG
ncbi:hypothetical protein E3E29_02630 [Thermococcus sp. Bubb.Bath]|nr:hypothetical protein [Thermococcus sp. Bubb.Bath]